MSFHSIAKRRPLCLALIAGFELVWLGGVATAQSKPEEITVVAPREIDRKQAAPSYTGTPVDEISVSYEVPYDDLDLKKTADVATLNKRAADMAKEACSEVNKLPPYGDDKSQRACLRKSVKAAQDQVDAAVSAAGK